MYALLAVGLIAVYTVRNVINIAQGDIASLAGFGAIWLIAAGMPMLLAILVAILSVTLVSIVIERVIIARVKNMTVLGPLIVTLGVSNPPRGVDAHSVGPRGRGECRRCPVRICSSGA